MIMVSEALRLGEENSPPYTESQKSNRPTYEKRSRLRSTYRILGVQLHDFWEY